jgi:dihydrofolate reductase
MRKIVLGLAVSLDGFIEGPDGEYDWCFTDQDYGLNEFLKRIDAIFMGRKSFEEAQKYKGVSPWKGIKIYVVSNTMKSSDETEVISSDVISKIKNIKNEKGKDIWLFGGAELTKSLINENLVDELWLSIHPVILGGGKPLFQNIKERKNLKLKEHKIYSTGLVSLVYQPF